MTEAEFQDKVVTLAKFLGWRLFHPKRAQLAGRWATHAQGDPGWPDLAMVHPKRGFIVAELKTDTGRVSPGQRLWLNDLEACDVECYIWRPKDWPAIEARLQERVR